jgi:hypothetical protein
LLGLGAVDELGADCRKPNSELNYIQDVFIQDLRQPT